MELLSTTTFRTAWTLIGTGCTEEAHALPAVRMSCRESPVTTYVTTAKQAGM
jgi:hypothetical protein